MTVEANPGAPASAGLVEAHRRMLADASLQFAFKPVVPPKPPAWLKPLLEFIASIAPVLMYVFWGLVAAGLLLIVFMIMRELVRTRWPERFGVGRGPNLEAEDWRPTAAQALALLEDVDRLAAQGRFAEAVHLLLHRSIQDIQGKRPNLVRPALTSRDISSLSALPDQARDAFGGIARVVERSRFGGAPVGAEDFADCRRAYEAFAFPEVWA
jgi:hypothetical protein